MWLHRTMHCMCTDSQEVSTLMLGIYGCFLRVMPYTLTYCFIVLTHMPHACTYTDTHTHTIIHCTYSHLHTDAHTQILSRLLILCERLTATLPMVRSARSSLKSTLKYAMGENQRSVDIARLSVVVYG